MRVIIDFREGADSHSAGKGEYVRRVVTTLLQIKPNWELVLLTTKQQTVNLPSGKWRQQAFGGGKLFWHLFVSFWCNITKRGDVYFATTSAIAPCLIWRLPVVMTIFDFTVWRYPATHLSHAVRMEKLFLPIAIKRAKHLLAISEFTKREAVELFHISPDKITTTLLGVGSEFKPFKLTAQIVSRLRKSYNLPEKFILYLGTLEPRKNLTTLIKAFHSLDKKFSDTKLVLAGSWGWQSDDVKSMLSEDVVVTGYIKEDDKPALYSLAEIFVFPSLYEGFGIPPLEAMACGTPTIVSDRASLPEVVGRGAIKVDISSIKPLAYTMGQVLGSTDLQANLSMSGIHQARKLTWENTTQKTGEVIEKYG